MAVARNLRLFTPYLVCSLEGVCHGVYLLWLTVHRGFSPVTAALALAGGDLALLLLEVPTGVFADRIGARASLILGSIAQIAGLSLFYVAASRPALVLAALAIAAGDAFRHGADEALLYRSCAATGQVESFERRVASARAAVVAALVALTTLGGFIAEHVGFDAAWAVEIALSVVGLGLALAMVEPPRAPLSVEAEESAPRPPLLGLLSRLPWLLILPVTLTDAFGSSLELVAQTRGGSTTRPLTLALMIASAPAIEVLGAVAVARGWVRPSRRALDGVGIVALVGLALAVIAPATLWPGLLVIFFGAGMAQPIRSALVQRSAHDGERATVSSAASAIDMLGKTIALPLAAWWVERMR